MTYQKVKEELVDKRKVVSQKELKKFSIFMFLLIFGVATCISIPVMCILGTTFALVVMIGCLFVYLQVFNLICEEDEDGSAFKRWNKVSKAWIVPYILAIAVVFVLKYFKFL